MIFLAPFSVLSESSVVDVESGNREGRKWITITIMITITENFRVYPQSLPPIGHVFCYTATMNMGRTFRKLAKIVAVAVAVLPSLVQAFIPLHEADGSVHARLAAPTVGQGLRLERGHSCPRHTWGWKPPAPLAHAIVDNEGDIVNRYAYDSFGVIDWDYSYETVPNRYTFQGREYDHERGDYYFRNRVYVPEWGLFSGPDMNLAAGPYGEPHGLMSYVFCGNDPWRYADPMGLDSMMNSVSMDLATGRTVAGSDVAEIASWALSPSHVYTENALYPFGLAGHAALSPALGSLERFNARRDYYDSFWLSLNHSLNPMVQCVVSGGEAGTGMGMQYGNSGVNLTQGECWMAGGRSVLALGESAFIASAAVSSTAGQFVTATIETGSRSQARILLELNKSVTGPVAFSSVEEAAIRGGRPMVQDVASPFATKTTPIQLELNFGQSLPWQRGESGLVIGRGRDLAKPGALGPGEYTLSWFSVQETSGMEAEWAINNSKLSKVMSFGKPIRDASSIENFGGFYLNRERYTQQFLGWHYNSGRWLPPGK